MIPFRNRRSRKMDADADMRYGPWADVPDDEEDDGVFPDNEEEDLDSDEEE